MLSHFKQQRRNAILRTVLDYELTNCIYDHILNTLNGNLSMNKQQKRNLRRHATTQWTIVANGLRNEN